MATKTTVSKVEILRVLLSIGQSRIRENTRAAALQVLKDEALAYPVNDADGKASGNEWGLSDRGEAFIDALERLPYPVQVTKWEVWSKDLETPAFAVKGGDQ